MSVNSSSPRPEAQPDSLKPSDLISIGKNKGGTRKKGVRIVEIEWIDAVAVGGEDWADETELDIYGMPSLTIGYVINETDETITIVSLVNMTHYSHGITIPKGCVTAIKNLSAR